MDEGQRPTIPADIIGISLNRRRFLKYAGATAAVVGASALGLDYALKAQLSQPTQVTTTTSKFNYPPVAAFDYTPKYLNPTDQQTVQFTNLSTDLDNDLLKYAWFVDDQIVSENKDYSTKLPVGQHLIRLNVSDSQAGDVTEKTVTVEPDQIYPTKTLHIAYKGMRMSVGWKGDSHAPIDRQDEKLDVIRNELGCNALIIYGYADFEDDLINVGKLAVGKRFDRIYLTPMYLDFSIDDTVQRIGSFASRIKALREKSDSIVFMVGHEFSLDSSSFVPGATYDEREQNAWNGQFNWRKGLSVMPSAFSKIISLCKQNYGYPIAYASTTWEADNVVPWEDSTFESIGVDAYVWNKVGWTQQYVTNEIEKLSQQYRKQVMVTEWGCCSFKNASEDWQAEPGPDYPYDEDEQANYIQQYCDMLNRSAATGCFYTQIDDERPKGYGLYLATTHPFGPGSKRKKGFYMYKSYQRSD